MNSFSLGLFCLCILFGAGIAAAEEPSTAPATAPVQPVTGAAAEQVKSGLKAYNAAMHAGDIDSMFAMQHATDDDQRRLARAIARADAQVARLMQAAQEKFAGDAMAEVGRAIGDATDADVEQADVYLQEDRAMLVFSSGGAVAMTRLNDKWISDVSHTLESFGSADSAIDSFSRRGNFAKVTAQDVAAGKYKSLKELIVRIERQQRGESEEVPN